MREAWTWLRGRLARRPDSEHAQGLLRLGLILLVLGYLLLPSTRSRPRSSAATQAGSKSLPDSSEM